MTTDPPVRNKEGEILGLYRLMSPQDQKDLLAMLEGKKPWPPGQNPLAG